MKVTHFNLAFPGGGSGRIASDLYHGLKDKSHEVEICVAHSDSESTTSIGRKLNYPIINQYLGPFISYRLQKLCHALRRTKGDFWDQLAINCSNYLYQPSLTLHNVLGWECFDYDGVWKWINSQNPIPDIVHCHDLLNYFFDLRALQNLSNKTKVFLTLHNSWYYTGLCHHYVNCDRWKNACGRCPQLDDFAQMKRDGTSHNLSVKSKIYQNSSLYVVSPVQWLLNDAYESVMAPAIKDSEVIANGIDIKEFKPANKAEVRKEIGIPVGAWVLLMVGNRTKSNKWKRYDWMRDSFNKLCERYPEQQILFIAVGGNSDEDNVDLYDGKSRVLHYAHTNSFLELSKYYQTADVYLHAALKDTFGLVVVEAMACGLPTVANRVGGVMEIIESGVDGFLVDEWNSEETMNRIAFLCKERQSDQVKQMQINCRKKAEARYDVKDMVDRYLSFYERVLSN